MGNYVSLLCVCVRHDTFTYAQESEKEDNLKKGTCFGQHTGDVKREESPHTAAADTSKVLKIQE